MAAFITAWFAQNLTKIIEFAVGAIVFAAIIFAIWFGMHQRVEMATKVGTMEAQIATQAQHEADFRAEIARLNALYAQQAADTQVALENAQALNDRLTTIRTETDRRITAIDRHDLGRIGSAKPDLLEARINKATRETLARLRDLTK